MAKNNSKKSEATEVTESTAFKPERPANEEADKRMLDAAAELKTKPDTRERIMAIKVHACNGIDKLQEDREVSEEEKKYWRKVKLNLSVR